LAATVPSPINASVKDFFPIEGSRRSESVGNVSIEPTKFRTNPTLITDWLNP